MSTQFKIAIIAGLLWWFFRVTTGKCVEQGEMPAARLSANIAFFCFISFVITFVWGIVIL